MNRRRLATDLVALAILAPVAISATQCHKADAPAAAAGQGDVVRMPLGRETFTLEIADDDSEQQWGLMARESMPADHGMIFVFPEESRRAFWMKNTLIPLDIVYVAESGRVVSVKQMQPRDETPVPSDGPAMYAIELNQGAAARAGIKAGDVLTIPNEILSRQKRR
jgi:uncharacterized membrane protein (UPF0127 family)